MRNQCDGCQAGRPLVRLVDHVWKVDATAKTHIMGKHKVLGDRVVTIGYPDLMACCKADYQEKR